MSNIQAQGNINALADSYKKKAKSGMGSGEKKAEWYDKHSPANSPYTTIKELNNQRDFESLIEQVDKDIDMAIKIMMVTAENMDPEGEDSKASDMAATSNVIASLSGTKSNVYAMQAMKDAIENPGFSATEIQDRSIKYDDATRYFDGNDPVEFNFQINYEDRSETPYINANYHIMNAKNEIIFRGQLSNLKRGDNKFLWNGELNDYAKAANSVITQSGDKITAPGEYSIKVFAKGSVKGLEGKRQEVAIAATTEISGIAKEIILNEGRADRIVLDNGKIINKLSVTKINSIPEKDDSFKADIAMIGDNAKLDLSKFEIKNGLAKIEYFNKYPSNEKVSVKIKDMNGFNITSIDLNHPLSYGHGFINLSKDDTEHISDGNYKAQIELYDKETNTTNLINGEHEIVISGVNTRKNEVTDVEGDKFDAKLITDIFRPAITELDNLKAEYLNKDIDYSNELIKFNGKSYEVDHLVPLPDDNAILHSTELHVHNMENNKVDIKTFRPNYYNLLNDDAKKIIDQEIINSYAQDFGANISYSILPSAQKTDIDKLIKNKINEEIKAEKSGASPEEIVHWIDEKYKEIYVKDSVIPMQYSWDGAFNEEYYPDGKGNIARKNDEFKVSFSHNYLKDDGTSFGSNVNDAPVESSTIEEIIKDGNKYFYKLKDGQQIQKKQIITIYK